MNWRVLGWLCVVGLMIFFSCVEEDDCVGCNLNPKISLKFVAQDTRETTDSLLEAVNSQIAEFTDSLLVQLTAEERSALVAALVGLREDSVKYDEESTLFRAGKTRISFIEAPGSTSLEQFQDSIIRDFSIPVDMQSDTSTYYFGYHEHTDTIQLYYQRALNQTLDGMRMRLHSIGVNEQITTFDSVLVECNNAACTNDQTTVYIYF